MSERTFWTLENVKLTESREILRRANNNQLQIIGKAIIMLQVGYMTKPIGFTVVKEMSPVIIGGVDLQEQFGFSW